MMNTIFLNSFIKSIFLSISIIYIFIKIINFKNLNINKTIIIIFSAIFIAIIYAVCKIYLSVFLSTVISSMFIILLMMYITKQKLKDSLFIGLISLGITYIGFIISTFISAFLVNIFPYKIPRGNTAGIFIIYSINILIIFLFFKIKRFKNGFIFLNNKNDSFRLIGILIVALILILYSFLGNYRTLINESMLCGIFLLSIILIIFIKKQITLTYKQMLRDDTILQLETELNEEKRKNEEATKEIENLAKINHKYSTRISAAEWYIKELCNNYKCEISDELLEVDRLIKNLSKEYSNELTSKSKYARELPKTNVVELDALLNYLQKEAKKENIKFSLINNCNIDKMIKKCVSQNKLETLLGDHIKDAIIAIKTSSNKNRNIKLIFDIKDNNYEIKFYDTGAEFEINTLLKLGLEQTTTHKDTGGSGIGFMTTFETLKECKGSLIIEEYNKKTNVFAKSITIRFDGKNEYKLKSYRAEEIIKENKDNRIIVEML